MSTAATAGTLLDPKRTVLIVVDVQEKLLPAIDDRERVLRNSLLLLRLAHVLELPVILTTQYRKGLGEIVPEITLAAPAIAPLDKVAFGCFGSGEFEARLAELAVRDQLVVAGVEAHICVAQTVLGALAKGFTGPCRRDAVGSRSAENRAIGCAAWKRRGRWSRARDGDLRAAVPQRRAAFKAMLPHLRRVAPDLRESAQNAMVRRRRREGERAKRNVKMSFAVRFRGARLPGSAGGEPSSASHLRLSFATWRAGCGSRSIPAEATRRASTPSCVRSR